MALIRGRLLNLLTHDLCSVYSRVATFRRAAFIPGNTVNLSSLVAVEVNSQAVDPCPLLGGGVSLLCIWLRPGSTDGNCTWQ